MGRRALVAVLVVCSFVILRPASAAPRSLDLAQRTSCRAAVEAVYAKHRGTAPVTDPLRAARRDAALRARVDDELRANAALEIFWRRPLTTAQLQAELDRLAAQTANAPFLREIFTALGDDPFLAAECLARPLLADRLARTWYAKDAADAGTARGARDFTVWLHGASIPARDPAPADAAALRLPRVAAAPCTPGTWRPTIDVPRERDMHDAFWTGSHVLVWGGSADYRAVPTGALYDPLTDSWSTIDMTVPGAPRDVVESVAVWTGAELIVWGGFYYDSEAVPNGSRFDPDSRTWTPMSAPDPSVTVPQAYMTAAWTGTEMVVVGSGAAAAFDPHGNTWRQLAAPPFNVPDEVGFYKSKTLVLGGDVYVFPDAWMAPAWRYSLAADAWSELPQDNAPESFFGASVVSTGSSILVFGGQGGSGVLGTGARFDLATQAWSPISTTDAPRPRMRHSAVWTGTEMIVLGGETQGWWGTSTLGDALAYDPVADSWRWVGNDLQLWRTQHAAVWTGQEVIAWGGDQVNYERIPQRSGARLDPATGVILPTHDETIVAAGAAVWTGAELLTWLEVDRSVPQSVVQRYDSVSRTWGAPEYAPAEFAVRTNESLVWTGRELAVWGGYSESPWPTGYGDGILYDPATHAWRPIAETADSAAARWNHTAVWTGREMIVWGGLQCIDYQGRPCVQRFPLAAGARYDADRDAWAPLGDAAQPSPRSSHAAFWTPYGMLVWGGFDVNGAANTGGIYDLANDAWNPLVTDDNTPYFPSSRSTAVWSRDALFVWGSANGSSMSWNASRYDAARNAWRPMTRDGGPVGYMGSIVAATEKGLFHWGGYDLTQSETRDDTFEYDAAHDTWQALTASGWFGHFHGAPAMHGVAQAFAAGDEMLVWAGSFRPDGKPILAGDSAFYCLSALPTGNAPVANAGPDQVLECVADRGATAHLDGSASTGDIASYAWSDATGALGEGVTLDVPFVLGAHDVTLTVADATGLTSTDTAVVTVQDTTPPAGAITYPAAGACIGPAALPVVVQDGMRDACEGDAVTRTYDPPGGPSYAAHGDHQVTLTATDPSGNAAAAGVSFTIDTVPPQVTLLAGPGQYALPLSVPFAALFRATDDDGAAGGVVHETVALDGCVVFDGSSYGNGDGLLSDETLVLDAGTLCRAAIACGRNGWTNPVLTVRATDCGGNAGTAGTTLRGSVRVPAGGCGR